MKNTKVHIFSIVLGAFITVVVISLVSASQEDTEVTASEEKPQTLKSADSDYQELIKQNYHIYSLPIPLEVSFSGEMVPVENSLVWESLDRELLTNTYWHSNTLFYIKRASRWFPIIEPILKEEGIPDDFKYLAVIESGLVNATSPSGAKGFWQFMNSTAKGYNLEISEDVDERNHLEKATRAACKYLKEAYNKFGNWTLAAASYNMGKAGLLGQLQAQKVDNYYDLLLNTETSRYVFRIVAIKYILSAPENYGFNVREEDLYDPFEVKKIEIDTSVGSWVDFAISQGTNYKVLKHINPWMISKKLDNPVGKKYEILIPSEGKTLGNVGSTDNKFGKDE